MTEKRFTISSDNNQNIYDVEKCYFLSIDVVKLCDLLNALYDENEQLKQREKTLEGMIRTFDEGCKEIYDDKCRLEKENEQLVQRIKELEIENQGQSDAIDGLQEMMAHYDLEDLE